jgi:serpin B
MMHRSGFNRIAQTDGVKVLELAYEGGSAAMLFILPDRADGLAEVEKSLTAARFDSWIAALAPGTVSITLPRFEVNSRLALSLGGVLMTLGMPDAFNDDKADFTGIANPTDPRDRLKIDKVFHKAFVKVDEEGTEAAAAMAAIAATRGLPPENMIEFRADHPFLFAIVDKATGLLLFLGRVSDPTTK